MKARHIPALSETGFAKFAVEQGVTECERVGNVFHFECEDGTNGTYVLSDNSVRYHKQSFVWKRKETT